MTDKGGVVVNESGACLLYLLEQYGELPCINSAWPTSGAALLSAFKRWCVAATSSVLTLATLTPSLCRRAGNGRLEPSRSDAVARGQFLQFIFMAETELTSHLERYYWHTFQLPEDKRLPQVAQIGKDK